MAVLITDFISFQSQILIIVIRLSQFLLFNKFCVGIFKFCELIVYNLLIIKVLQQIFFEKVIFFMFGDKIDIAENKFTIAE